MFVYVEGSSIEVCLCGVMAVSVVCLLIASILMQVKQAQIKDTPVLALFSLTTALLKMHEKRGTCRTLEYACNVL